MIYYKLIGELSTYILKGVVIYIYEAFMVHIPQNEVENMVDLAFGDSSCYVRKVVLNGKQKLNVEYPRQMFNRIANYMHIYAGTKELYVPSQGIVKLLKEYYEKEMAVNFQDKSGPVQSRNELKISYFANGLNHQIKLYIDENWKLIEDETQKGLEDSRLYRSHGFNHNTLSLNNAPSLLTKDKFINTLQKLPLLDYLCSLENIGSSNVLESIQEVGFTVITII